MIEHVAFRFPDGMVRMAKKPARHHDLIYNEPMYQDLFGKAEQGFWTKEHGFLTRKQAARIALKSGQIKELSRPETGELFSEDLW